MYEDGIMFVNKLYIENITLCLFMLVLIKLTILISN